MPFRIDPVFKDYLGALEGEAKVALEQSLMAEGCRDALIVWPQPDGDPILLDGHNRYAICEDLGIPYRVIECPIPIADRQRAMSWLVENQRGRRNISKAQLDYLSAKVYGGIKEEWGGDRKSEAEKSKCQNGTLISGKDAAERVAEEFGISRRKVLRNAKFAERVDAITAEHGPEAKVEILAGRKKVADFAPPPELVAEPGPVEVADVPAPAPAKPSPPDFQNMSSSECVDWMAENLQPNGESGAVAKPIPMPEGASENLVDPEVAARGDNPFIFALCQMESQVTRAELGLKLHPPASDLRPALKKRLADLSTALQKLSISLENLS